MKQVVLACAAVVLIVSIPSYAQTSRPRYQLLDAVVFHAFLLPDASAYPPPVRALLQEHAKRAQTYRPRRRPLGLKGAMVSVFEARENYERRLVASAGTSGVERLAQQYVDELHLCYEWEGFHDCPENEAKFAEQYLAKNPNSPFRELLPLLAANRWLCTAEGYEMEERPQDAARSRKAGAAQLGVALKSQSLLMRTAAQELRTRGRCHSS
jgi:hypothetical protein